MLDIVKKLGGDDADRVHNNLTRVLCESTAAVGKHDTSYLYHLETLTLAPTKGDATLAKAKKVFTGCIDGDFKNWSTDVGGEDTTETKVDVHEMTRNGTFQTLFGSLGDPRKLCLTQGQIEEFCHSYRDSLRQEGYGTFFLFEVKSELFVAGVRVDDGKLKADVDLFACGVEWDEGNRHRWVVKQQTVCSSPWWGVF